MRETDRHINGKKIAYIEIDFARHRQKAIKETEKKYAKEEQMTDKET